MSKSYGFDKNLTSNNRFAHPFKEIDIEDGAQHALHDTDLAAQAQWQQHQEEDDRPERSWGQFEDGLSEHDES